MAALCSDRQQQLRFVVISTDGGRHFGARQPLPGSPSVNFLAISDAHRVFAGNGVEEGDTGSGQFTYQLLASSDGGRHWRVALSETRPLSDVPHGYLGFQSPTVGRKIISCVQQRGSCAWTYSHARAISFGSSIAPCGTP